MPRMADGRDVPDATFACPDLTTFTRLDELGLEVIGHDSSQMGLSWRAESSIPTTPRTGVVGADAKGYRTTA